MDINIADLIKPKFHAGQTVFHVHRDYNGRVQNIQTRRIESVVFSVNITNEKGLEKRTVDLVYNFPNGAVGVREGALVASLNDLPESDRKAVI